MFALLQSIPVLFFVLLFPARGDLRKFFLLSAIITLPFRTDYFIGQNGHQGWVDGIAITLSDICLFGFWIMSKARGETNSYIPSGIPKAACFFLLTCVLSIVNTVSKPLSVLQFVMFTQVFLLNFCIIATCVRSREDFNTALLGIALCILFQGIIASLQFYLQNNFLLFSTGYFQGETIVVEDSQSDLIRVFGTLAKPNSYPMVLAPFILITCVMLQNHELSGRFIRWMSVIFSFLGLVFCGSRGGWLSFSIAIGVYVFWRISQAKGSRIKLICASLIVIALTTLICGSVILKRLESDDKNAAMSRVPLLTIALNIFETHPLVGVGVNTYQNVMRKYVPRDFDDRIWIGQVHNHYLLILAETGFLGFIAFLVLSKNLIKEGLSLYKTSLNTTFGLYGLGFILAIVQAGVHMMFEAYIVKQILAVLFLLAGLVIAARKMDEEELSALFQADEIISADRVFHSEG